MTEPILKIRDLRKAYEGGVEALKGVDLDIRRGEIFALLGPNGAGKTTLIGVTCGTVSKTSGSILVDGHDHEREFRAARSMIGLVPQELTTDAFETVWATVNFSRGLFGKARDDLYLENLLKRLSLWDKRNAKMMELSGGMKRRVMIAKALSHQPSILFLDEPTAGVDVELRRDMWDLVRDLRRDGTTIILTTHYIEEAEEMADRVGVIRKGELVALGDKAELMQRMGQKTLKVTLETPFETLPPGLEGDGISLEDHGHVLTYRFDGHATETGVRALLRKLDALDIGWKDLSTQQSSLEDIFVSLVHSGEPA
jgi:ABC-2 type transport system ATP-binding protein